jgi:hypothetical protein
MPRARGWFTSRAREAGRGSLARPREIVYDNTRMAPFPSRPAGRQVVASRLTLVVSAALAGAVALAALPAAARTGAKAGARGPTSASADLFSVEGPACLFPIPGQECSEEERRLCDVPPAPDPVVVDCHDPANAWVLEMLGECECQHLHPRGGHLLAGRERERPHDQTCLDAESCGATPSAAAPLTTSLQYQPAIDRAPATERSPAGRLSPIRVIVRHHPGYARGIEHPPKA